MRILDSTDPIQIRDLEGSLSLENTLFIVSSKSGDTLEPNILFDYFFHRMVECVGKSGAGRHFVAITDPGSRLEQKARDHAFRAIYHGDFHIGGRYSVLSHFGLVPAALMGVDLPKFLTLTSFMVQACGPETPSRENPGVVLGTVLGVLGQAGRDKVTIICSPEITGFGAWLEQLLAESTGKQDKGLIPIDREGVLSPEGYGRDRLFVYLRTAEDSDSPLDAKLSALEQAGNPVVRISVTDRYHLGQEFFRWEAAVAVAGSILGINPFDQPDVEASKVATRALTDQFERDGALAAEVPVFQDEEMQIYVDPAHPTGLGTRAPGDVTVVDYLRSHLRQIQPGDYFALLAYLPMNERSDQALQEIRSQVLRARKVATCAEFGPRFLHSTGQVYKGGPNTGVFLQLTSHNTADLQVPGRRFTFGVVKDAEARGDLSVLIKRRRRAMRIHFRRGPASGMAALGRAMKEAVA